MYKKDVPYIIEAMKEVPGGGTSFWIFMVTNGC